MGLAERYVQDVLNCHQAVLQQHPDMIMRKALYLWSVLVRSLSFRSLAEGITLMQM